MFVGVSSGVMVLTVLRDFAPTLLRNLSLLAANPTVRHVQVVVGLLLLLLAALVSSGMPVRQRFGLRVPVPGVVPVPVPVGIGDDPTSLLLQPIAPTGMSQWMGRARSMFKGESLWVALAAGLGQGPAPPEYLVALVAILASRANIGTQIGLAVMFNLIMLGVCELTLISYLAMPTKTEAIVGRLHGWVGAHRRRIISLIVGVVAVCLIVTGSS
jgi:hypothetical protein